MKEDQEGPRAGIHLAPIGVIRSPFREPNGTPIQPCLAQGAAGTVELRADLQAGLKDLDGFDRIWLVYWFHQASEHRLLVTPFLDNEKHGVFATRAPARPNAIGISVVRLLRVDGNILEVADLDIIDGTPLLDIKPYVPQFDCYPVERAGWLDSAAIERRTADGRFTSYGRQPVEALDKL
jgi:tRNA-Thr(GGU) m(6)t(6)A37 methyltransferase TsaA